MAPKVILVTGTSTGVGKCIVEAILAQGNIAVATLRKPSALEDLTKQYSADKLLVLPLDVTNKEQVAEVFKKVEETFGQLDVVISNAGIAILNEVEGGLEADEKMIFDTNFWGHLSVMKQAVRFFRDVNKVKGGHMISITSYAGVLPAAGLGMYCAAKAAQGMITDAFMTEIEPSWNIKSTVVELGGVATTILTRQDERPVHPAYDEEKGKQSRKHFIDVVGNGVPAPKAAELILSLASLENPPAHCPVGSDAYAVCEGRYELLLKLVHENEKISKANELSKL